MSIIEKAVERLDQLKRAGLGIELGGSDVGVCSSEEGFVTSSSASADSGESVDERAFARIIRSERSVREDSHSATSKFISLDLERLRALGMINPLDSRSNIAEEYRVIKRPLLKNVVNSSTHGGGYRNLIMITSSVPGEGKSFSAINLAMSIAMELDHTVLLVDADVARPSVLNILGLPPSKGLMDVLLSNGRVDLSEVLLRTNIEKLSLLPAGSPHSRATEFLASDSMNQMLSDIATRYSDRIVIFDSPPLLPTTEARVLAMHMGQVVMVVEAGSTTHGMVKQALSTIESCPLKLMLLNKARDASTSGYYGYHDGPYGYGSKN